MANTSTIPCLLMIKEISLTGMEILFREREMQNIIGRRPVDGHYRLKLNGKDYTPWMRSSIFIILQTDGYKIVILHLLRQQEHISPKKDKLPALYGA